MNTEERNFYNDHRTRAAERDNWWDRLDERSMIAFVIMEDDEGVEQEYAFPIKYGVCDTCRGKGTHVDPNIDCCGLTREDFDEDPDFAESYVRGDYNVPCYGCGGTRVTPEVDEDKLGDEGREHFEMLQQREREEAEYQAICRAERMMGA